MVDAERQLWRAVLGQAYEDAELPLMNDGSEPRERTLAREFLRADDVHIMKWLRAACDWADVPFDRVLRWARERYPPPSVN
jgi:hypothetical protein